MPSSMPLLSAGFLAHPIGSRVRKGFGRRSRLTLSNGALHLSLMRTALCGLDGKASSTLIECTAAETLASTTAKSMVAPPLLDLHVGQPGSKITPLMRWTQVAASLASAAGLRLKSPAIIHGPAEPLTIAPALSSSRWFRSVMPSECHR